MQSRKHDSITDEDVACLIAPGHAELDRAGAPGRRVPRPAVGRPPRHRRRLLPPSWARSSPRRRSSSWASPAPTPWACTGSSTRSTRSARARRSSPTAPTRSTRPWTPTVEPPRDAGMSETVLVTGATGLAGANVCKQLDRARRPRPGPGPRQRRHRPAGRRSGVEVVTGDVTDADDVLRAATGSDSAIHCAALLGGASQNLGRLPGRQRRTGPGTCSTRRRPLDLRRVVAVSTGHLLRHRRRASTARTRPVTKEPSSDPYTITKMAAFEDAMARAAAGQRRGHHPSRRHLRTVPGGQQRARHRRASTGCCCPPSADASSGTSGSR